MNSVRWVQTEQPIQIVFMCAYRHKAKKKRESARREKSQEERRKERERVEKIHHETKIIKITSPAKHLWSNKYDGTFRITHRWLLVVVMMVVGVSTQCELWVAEVSDFNKINVLCRQCSWGIHIRHPDTHTYTRRTYTNFIVYLMPFILRHLSHFTFL